MLQDIKDEVLAGEPLYVIEGSDGTVLQDNVKITRKTPVVEEATELNRATLANLQGDLYTQDRYNVPNISYELMGIGLVEGDIIPKTWVKETDTKYNAEEITLRSSSTPSETYALNKACDGDEGSYFSGANDISEDFCRIRFDEPKKITKMHVNIKSTNYMNSDYQSVKIQGSKDLSSWIDLYNVPLSSNMIYSEDVVLQNVDYYKYYRIFATLNYNSLKVAEWGVVEYEGEIYDYVFNLDLPLTSYESGKIVNIEESNFEGITSFENPYININNLGAKQINGTIESGKKYTLTYNGESWDIINNYVIGTYTGNGELTQDIILGFKPKVVIITSASGRMGFQSGNSSAYTYVYGGIFMEGFPLANFAGDITENGFRVRYNESTSSNKPMTNSTLAASNPYRYIAFI